MLTDNNTAFRSKLFAEFAGRWCMHVQFRYAHVPSDNGIVERCHRTGKIIVAMKGCTVAEAVYLYNMTPRDDQDATTAPANMLYGYPVRVHEIDGCTVDGVDADSLYQPGDEV